MSLPSGLVFFLDFTREGERGPDLEGESVFGQGVVGSEIVGGVDIGPGGRSEETGLYNLSQGYSSARGASNVPGATAASLVDITGDVSGTAAPAIFDLGLDSLGLETAAEVDTARRLLRFDADLLDTVAQAGNVAVVLELEPDSFAVCDSVLGTGDTGLDLGGTANLIAQFPKNSLMTLAYDNGVGGNSMTANTRGDCRIVRRLTELTIPLTATNAAALRQSDLIQVAAIPVAPATGPSGHAIRVVVVGPLAQMVTDPFVAAAALGTGDGAGGGSNSTTAVGAAATENLDITYAIVDPVNAVDGGRGALEHLATAELESTLASPFLTDGMSIPEIDIRVDSVSLVAETKKMKAKWTQELQQDLNAYHNLDAEVELTSVLSEQIALELDQEILHDLITGATAGTRYWSREPGTFVNKTTGAPTAGGTFTGTVSEWYETLIETVNDVSAQIHRKTLRGGANFLVCGPEVANVLEFTSGFRASVTHDDDTGTVGAVKEGSINKKWDLYVDPYFPRNVILVGRKGSSFLESG
jgi:hypothetical protein